MPYIKMEDRPQLDSHVDLLVSKVQTVGELNYAVTRLAMGYLRKIGVNYSNISNVIGTLTLIPVEIVRRFVSKYEDAKIEQNGDLKEFE